MKKQSLSHQIRNANPFRVVGGVIIGIVIFAVLLFALKQNLDNRSKAGYYGRKYLGPCSTLSCPNNMSKIPVMKRAEGGGQAGGSTEKMCTCIRAGFNRKDPNQ